MLIVTCLLIGALPNQVSYFHEILSIANGLLILVVVIRIVAFCLCYSSGGKFFARLHCPTRFKHTWMTSMMFVIGNFRDHGYSAMEKRYGNDALRYMKSLELNSPLVKRVLSAADIKMNGLQLINFHTLCELMDGQSWISNFTVGLQSFHNFCNRCA